MSRSVHYLEFRQAVRRYAPSVLIPFLAKHSARHDPMRNGTADVMQRPPWAVSAIARDALLYGTEFRAAVPDDRALQHLFSLYMDVVGFTDESSIASIMTPLAYEQFPYQESAFEELARIHALFVDPALGPAADWSEVFGMSLDDAVRAVIVLNGWVAHNQGQYDPAILDLPHFQEVFARVAPRTQIEGLVKALTMTVAEAREINDRVPALPINAQKSAFNPLISKPFVDLGVDGIWAPQTMLVHRALVPANLYYWGARAWGDRFTKELGDRTEAYVGNQVRLIAGESMSGEMAYDKGRRKSTDWIWVTNRAVILFESKSARMTLGAQAGDATLPAVTARYLGHARDQLDRTEQLIRERVPPFDRIPDDRPIVGVVVTSEPFYLGNSTLVEYGEGSRIPSIAMSLRDLEHWACLEPAIALNVLLDVVLDQEQRTWSFSSALQQRGLLDRSRRNPILDEAWKAYAFLNQSAEEYGDGSR